MKCLILTASTCKAPPELPLKHLIWNLKWSAYWSTAKELPGQLFKGLQLTDGLSEFCSSEYWTSTPESIPLSELKCFWSSNKLRTQGQNVSLREMIVFQLLRKQQKTHGMRVKTKKQWHAWHSWVLTSKRLQFACNLNIQWVHLLERIQYTEIKL